MAGPCSTQAQPGTGNFSINVATLSGSLAPGQYYLLKLGSGGANGVSLPTEDASQTGINMAAGAGKVVLVDTSAGLACNGGSTVCSPADLAHIMDLVGYGTANFFEGSAAPGPGNNATVIFRALGGCTDTNNNGADFSTGSPSPRNTASTFNVCAAPTPTPTPTPAPSPAPFSNAIKISQVYGGGGNSGSTYTNDFIELYNTGSTPVDITGWSVQYTNAIAAFAAQTVGPPPTPLTTTLFGTIQPGHYFLIQESQGAGGTTSLPTPDLTGGILVGSTAGKVALVASSNVLSGGTAGNCPTDPLIVDFVGYNSTATCSETSPTAPLTNLLAAIRKNNGCTDTDNNANDFLIDGPIPRNSSSPVNRCGGDPTQISGIGIATPDSVLPASNTLLTVSVSPASIPPSTGISVNADLTSIGGTASQQFYDDATHGDQIAGNNIFSFQATVGAFIPTGVKNIVATITDAEPRSATAPITLTVQSPTCGVERWSVKTGTDPDASQVDLNNSVPTTIASLRALTPPVTPPDNARFAPAETTVYVIRATMTLYKLETDVDYHIVVQDENGNTMVTEIPCPCCVGVGSPFAAGIANARAEFDSHLTATTFFQSVSIPVQITGVGFFDFIHGQTGVAPNGIELHPILDIKFFQPTTTSVTSSVNPSQYGQSVQITATVASSGTSMPTGNVTFSDGANVITSSVLNGSGQASFTSNSLSVGSHSITASYGGDSNSLPSISVVLTQVVNKAPLTVRADDKMRLQCEADPPFTVSYFGFVLGEGPVVLTGTLSFATPGADSGIVGTYPIIPSGLTSTNYDITFAEGVLTVNRETTPPTITAPAALNVSAGSACTAFVSDAMLGTANASDNCGAVTITRSGVPAGNIFLVGNTTITYTTDDGNGNTASATQIVSVVDNTPPTITCPADKTVSCDASTDPSATGTATATDNCITATVTYSDVTTPGSSAGNYTITRTWTATDASGNSSSCTQTVVVHDTTAPVPNVATLPTVTGVCSATISAPPTATDNCVGSVTGTTSNPLTYTTQGTFTVHWTYDDGNGNTSTQTQTVVVHDTTGPSIAPMGNIVVSNDPGQCSAVVNFSPMAMDNCSVPMVVANPASGTDFPKGTTTVTVTATDAAGNTSISSFTVTVNDAEAPMVTPPPNMNVPNYPGQCVASLYPGAATATDNCDQVTASGVRSDNKPLTDPYPIGTTEITWTATDTAGNTASATQTITVQNPASWTKYAVFGLDSVTISSAGDGTINMPGVVGDVAIGGGTGTLEKTTVNGRVLIATGANPSLHAQDFFAIPGPIMYGQNLTAAKNDALNASAQYAAMAPTQTWGNITTNTTITRTAARNVIAANLINLVKSNLTLVGGAGDVFIINVTSPTADFILNGSKILLSGGLTADHVFFNFPGTGGKLTLSKDETVTIANGTFLAPRRDIVIVKPPINGAVIGANVSLSSGQVNGMLGCP